MNCTKEFFRNAVKDIFTGVLVAAFILLIAGFASAQEKEIDLGDQLISAVDTVADSVAIIETKIKMNCLRENLALLVKAREKYAVRLSEIDRAIMRRRDENN